MKIRYCEGWLAALLAFQPWAGEVVRWSVEGGPKPVGLTFAGRIRLQLALGGTTDASHDGQPRDWDGGPVRSPAVDASPRTPVEWADALAQAATGAAHPGVKSVETYAQWGGSTKPGGLRIVCADGAEIFGSLI
ncbi:hypothetical protein GCM10011608_10960 [Micromonospora sonchi]|uniref:Uncharacterized protein n=1 Tax=Micromonospora sonchi TaxID=1763543 RepID=A0A917TMM1_9ACTN|nr:hypothetical protein [Micromonospora sonchi]GGM27939.1 hypothetical protein GCM10011608_10960 [Micromonospora sonchi]